MICAVTGVEGCDCDRPEGFGVEKEGADRAWRVKGTEEHLLWSGSQV